MELLRNKIERMSCPLEFPLYRFNGISLSSLTNERRVNKKELANMSLKEWMHIFSGIPNHLWETERDRKIDERERNWTPVLLFEEKVLVRNTQVYPGRERWESEILEEQNKRRESFQKGRELLRMEGGRKGGKDWKKREWKIFVFNNNRVSKF